ncbi:MAG: hypothetical protein ACK502_01525 [Alphaproteobacteria bacterium]
MNQQEKFVRAKLTQYFAQARFDYVYPNDGRFSVSSSYYKRPAVMLDIKDMHKAELNTLLSVLRSFLKHDHNADLFNPQTSEAPNFVEFELKHKSILSSKVRGFIFICGNENFETLRSHGLYPENHEKKAMSF